LGIRVDVVTESLRRALLVARSNPATTPLQLLAYAHAFPDADYTLLLVGEEEAGAAVVRQLCTELGVEVIDLATASARDFDCVIVHSYAHGDELAGLVSSLHHDEVWYYSDFFRNDFILAPGLDLSASVLIYFGWHLDDVGLRQELSAPAREVRIVPLESIRALWTMVGARIPTGLDAIPLIANDDLLVAVRYWGHGSMYQTLRLDTIVDAICDLDIPDSVRRVVIKRDPRALIDWNELMGRTRLRLRADLEVVEWEGPVESQALLGSLDVLDLYLFTRDWIHGHFFGFDGTPNVIVGITQPQAIIHWLDVGLLDSYFYNPTNRHMIEESLRWQQNIVAQYRSGQTTGLSSPYVGSHFRDLLNHPLSLETAIDRGFAGAIVNHLASTVELEPEPDLIALVTRVDALRRDRIHYERLWHAEEAVTDSLRGELAEHESQLVAKEAELSAARSELLAAEEAVLSLTSQLEASISEGERLQGVAAAELSATTAALREAEATAAQATAAGQEILSSRSWRLTSPIRAVSSGIRRFRPSRRPGALGNDERGHQ
jgi:hypothetical protein